NNINRIVQTFEGFSDQLHSQVASQKNNMLSDDFLMRQCPLQHTNRIVIKFQPPHAGAERVSISYTSRFLKT
ncbi:hypothetical protein, partial [Enterobacter cloacae]|uniref:hypothetical protein n=1 Tax=Enterobacter cloacae TaxID=550 RepID=UPI001C8BC342